MTSLSPRERAVKGALDECLEDGEPTPRMFLDILWARGFTVQQASPAESRETGSPGTGSASAGGPSRKVKRKS